MDFENMTDAELADLKKQVAEEEVNRNRRRIDAVILGVEELLKKYEVSEDDLLNELQKRAKNRPFDPNEPSQQRIDGKTFGSFVVSTL